MKQAANPENAAILALYHNQLSAMVEGNTNTLAELLASTFTLTHMTGYVQPKAEWLEQINEGLFRYYSYDEHDVSVEVFQGSAMLLARIMVDAEVYGSRANWRLQMDQSYSLHDDQWITDSSVVTTW